MTTSKILLIDVSPLSSPIVGKQVGVLESGALWPDEVGDPSPIDRIDKAVCVLTIPDYEVPLRYEETHNTTKAAVGLHRVLLQSGPGLPSPL